MFWHAVAFPRGNGAGYIRGMTAARINEPIEPTTLGNMGAGIAGPGGVGNDPE
jgi:hypothetical protein